QSKTALRIGQGLAYGFRELAAHPAIYKPPQPRHLSGLRHPISRYECCGGLLRAPQESGDVLRGMLSVAVHCERPLISMLVRVLPTSLQRCAFTLAAFVPQYMGACLFGKSDSSVSGPVIHHYDNREVKPNCHDQRLNRLRFIEARDDRCAL